VEELEARRLLSVFTPAGIRSAYGFDQINFNGAQADGSGQTIAIVNAYGNPNINDDLKVFDQRFGLPDPVLTAATPQGRAATDLGWASESALDVEWAHAIAPKANLLLVQAASPTLESLLNAVQYAAQQPGVSVVSLSWGTTEFAGETVYDPIFTTPGVTFVASSGDSGAWYGAQWPAASPNVVSVGGTSLTVTNTGAYVGETGWSSNTPWQAGSGGGISTFENEPAYQLGVQQTGARTVPDLAYNADPSTGYPVYSSTSGGWFVSGGTSAGAPQVAAMVALANQGRALAGKAPLDGAGQTLPALYQMGATSSTTYFNDVTSGYNGYTAGPGYDLVTGLGSPHANAVVSALVSADGTGSQLTLTTTTVTTPTPVSRTASRTGKTPVHHHNLVATSLGSVPVSTTTTTTTTLPVSTTNPTSSPIVTAFPPANPVFAVPPQATPLSFGAGAPVQQAAIPPVVAARPSAVDLSGGGGDNALVPTDANQGQVVPDLSVPDIVPELLPPGVKVVGADEYDDPSAEIRDVYFAQEKATPAAAEERTLAEESASALRPVAGAALILVLGGYCGETAARTEKRRAAFERVRR
jgi:subtilase family serine protease